MREKLIELIIKSGACFTRFPVGDCEKEEAQIIADYLIANGVTVPTKPEGYSFKDRGEIDTDHEAEDE